jgi:quercetin dioxygenase-like cupin family protein
MVSEKADYFWLREGARADDDADPRFLTVLDEVLGLPVVPGLVLRPVFGQNMTMSFVYMEPNTVAPVHQHPQEQMGTIIDGGYEFELDGVKRMVRPGDVYVVPPNVPHGAVTYEEGCLALDVFSPPREGFRELMDKVLAEQAAAERSKETT